MKNIQSKKAFWSDYHCYEFHNELSLTKKFAVKYINEFWKDIMSPLSDEDTVQIMFKVKFNYTSIKSFSKKRILNKSNADKKYFIDLVHRYITDFSDNYKGIDITDVFIAYHINQLLSESDNINPDQNIINYKAHKKITSYSWPLTMDITQWSNNINFNIDHTFAYFTLKNITYEFNIFNSFYICTIKETNNNKILWQFKDIKLNLQSSLDSFIRIVYKINNNENSNITGNQARPSKYDIHPKGDILSYFKYIDGNLVLESVNESVHDPNIITNFKKKYNKTKPDGKRYYSTSRPIIDPTKDDLYDNNLPLYSNEYLNSLEQSTDIIVNPTIDNNPGVLTLDLESRTLGYGNKKIIEIISACYYNGNDSTYKTYYINDYKNSSSMIRNLIKSLINPKFNGFSIYVHNLSGFDGVFLFKYILNLESIGYKVKFLIRDDKILSITISKPAIKKKVNSSDSSNNTKPQTVIEQEAFNLYIFDSYLLLPVSLDKLSKTFLPEKARKLKYDTTIHNSADLNDPNFKANLLEYNKSDCLVLYSIINQFALEIKNLFNIDISRLPTLTSLAFKIFRSNYMPDLIEEDTDKEKDSNIKPGKKIEWFNKAGNLVIYNKENALYNTNYQSYYDFKQSYRGGAVDVYKPYGKDLYYYDVNSLYPFVMSINEFPLGAYNYFKIHDNPSVVQLKDLFGIVKAEIKAPKDLYTPILLFSDPILTKGNVIAGLGEWTGWYCTVELEYAESLGYEIKILEGYHWKSKALIFNQYVNDLYKERLKYPSGTPKNMINKLLLNSLYGRFGMSPVLNEYTVWSHEAKPLGIDSDQGRRHDKEYLELITGASDILSIDYDSGLEFISRDVIHNLLKYTPKKRKDRNDNIMPIDQESIDPLYLDPLGILDIGNHAKISGTPLNINTPISIFVTAYARLYMAKWKVAYSNSLYYSDTDSLVLSEPLPTSDVGKELGKFKLEYKVDEGIFLGPKLYALKVQGADGPIEIIKIKGSKKSVSFDIFSSLLEKNINHTIPQTKWYRNLPDSSIEIINTLYTIQATENKRKFIYKANVDKLYLSDTKPYTIVSS